MNKQKNLDLERFNIFEFIGVYLGDGSIYINKNQGIYRFELSGNANDELDYFEKIAIFLRDEYQLKPRIFTRREKLGKTLKLIINNKEFIYYLLRKFNLKSGNKVFTGSIPHNLLAWKFSKHIIRGLFETDGSIYFSRTKPTNKANYPRIEIKTSSETLATQILNLLTKNGFIARIRTSKGDKTKGVYLSGDKMLQKWESNIGFSKMKTITKRQIYKQLGYYLPRSTLKNRLDLLEV